MKNTGLSTGLRDLAGLGPDGDAWGSPKGAGGPEADGDPWAAMDARDGAPKAGADAWAEMDARDGVTGGDPWAKLDEAAGEHGATAAASAVATTAVVKGVSDWRSDREKPKEPEVAAPTPGFGRSR